MDELEFLLYQIDNQCFFSAALLADTAAAKLCGCFAFFCFLFGIACATMSSSSSTNICNLTLCSFVGLPCWLGPVRKIIDNGQFRRQYLGTQSDWFRLCSQVKTWERSQLCSSEHPIILRCKELRSEPFPSPVLGTPAL